MKTIFFLLGIMTFINVKAQTSTELMVYSVKGNVTLIENNKETKLKIGKMLKAGSVIRTESLAMMTMVCKQGKPLSVTKAGTYPVSKWKDSCSSDHRSMTAKYFQYVWDQMYVRSEDYKREHPEATASVVRSNPPMGTEPLEIFVDPSLDTIYYAGNSFPLSWQPSYDYKGRYFFRLVTVSGNKTVYKDSLATNSVDLSKIKKYMKAGQSYRWIITAPTSQQVEGGIIFVTTQAIVNKKVESLQKAVDVPEENAAKFFRTAFLLKETQFIPAALEYYEKAARYAPDEPFYKEKLQEFKIQFQVITK